VSGEAILSAENSGKPLGGRGSAFNSAGEAHSAPSDPAAGGEEGVALGNYGPAVLVTQ